MSSRTSRSHEGTARPGPGRRQRCVYCSLLLAPTLRTHLIEHLDQQIIGLIRFWTHYEELSPNDVLCDECLTSFQERLSNQNLSQVEVAPAFGHRNVCLGCGISLVSRRTHRVPLNCPERNIILRWTPTHQMSFLEKTCMACWLAARRESQRQAQQDVNQALLVMSPDSGQAQQAASGVSVIPEPPPLPQDQPLQQPQQIVVENVIPEPPPLPQAQPQQQPQRRVIEKVNSRKYKRVAATSRHCLFVGCQNTANRLVPVSLKQVLLIEYNVYLPLNVRICHHHLHSNSWEELNAPYTDFTSFQIDDIFSKLEQAAKRTLDFNNVHTMDPHLCHYWLGLNARQFNELLNIVPSLNTISKKPKLALSILLAKLRTGDSNQRLASLFNLPRSTLERLMHKARNCLIQELVPNYLGTNNFSIQDVASRNRIIPEGFYGNTDMPPSTKPAIVICDGTYIYVQSSSNYLYQKKTYSLHKYANLVKPFLIVCCDGYILDCFGPYEATQNDSSIMSDLFREEQGRMRTFFREGDVFILDRGFRDVIGELQGYGYRPHMPESLLENEHQLTTEQANRSRCVTMCRWVVEVVNGRIKRDFKLFRQEYFNRASTHLMSDLKIACALLNKYHEPIPNSPYAAEYLAIAQAKLNTVNYLSDFVKRENINRRRTIFQNINSNAPHLNAFPRLTLNDLKRFSLGSYQLKQARSYYGEHVRSNGTYSVEISTDIEEDLPLILGHNNYLIRARIKSRHVSSRTYYTYLLISKDQNRANTLDSVVGYYCTCLVGNRTVGCCAHTLNVLWHLSWGRFNDVTAPAQFLDNIFGI